MNIRVQATNLTLTDNIREYALEKVNDAVRPFGDMADDPAVKVAVELEVDNGHHRKGDHVCRAEANLTIRGSLIRAEARAGDMYQAITQMKHKLTREIREWRDKRIKVARDGARAATALEADELRDEPALVSPAIEAAIPGRKMPDEEVDWTERDEASP
jgi:ribosomal subunit interface protein